MTEKRLLDPKNDYCFKRIFGTEKYKDVLIGFLNDMIPFPDNAKVMEVTFLPTSLDPDTFAKKQSVVDVLCVDERGSQYIVEMQVASTRGFEKRAQYYAAKAYTNQINEGGPYHNLKEIIFLAITNFIMFPDLPMYKSDHLILEKSTKQNLLKDFYFCFLELPKFNKELHELSTTVEKWAYFFKHATHTGPEEVEEIGKSDPLLKKAYLALNQFYWTPQEVNAYDREWKRVMDERAVHEQKEIDGFVKGEKVGFSKGKEEGKEEMRRELIQKLLKQGVDPKNIAQACDLQPEEIDLFRN
jgi:predicted transposase/invertase (TIGR01784 family)